MDILTEAESLVFLKLSELLNCDLQKRLDHGSHLYKIIPELTRDDINECLQTLSNYGLIRVTFVLFGKKTATYLMLTEAGQKHLLKSQEEGEGSR
ncbi:hypothetical protein LQZ19_11320 [Treponema primitia]|uniref:hypothetical protein n=1 Tax=Treponema primitia TaxID=88058 RepID=UPI00398001A8